MIVSSTLGEVCDGPYIGDDELKICANDRDEQGREEKTPVRRVCANKQKKQRADEVGESSNAHEYGAVDTRDQPLAQVAPHDTSNCLRQELGRNCQSRQLLHLLQIQRDPELAGSKRTIAKHDCQDAESKIAILPHGGRQER